MALQSRPKTQSKPSFLTSSGTFLLVFLGLLFGGALLPLATGLSLPIAWLSCGLVSLLFLLITRTRVTSFLTANLIFISGMLIVMDETSRSAIGSPAWNQALGGLVVAVWVAGLLYIVLASLVRLFGHQKVQRYFPPRVVGPTLMLAGLAALPFLVETTVISPVRDLGVSAYKSWVIFGCALVATLLFFFFKKTRKMFRLMPAAMGLSVGLISALLLDGIELLFLSKDLSQTLLLGPLGDIPQSLPIFVFQDLETYFGFWSYVHFDATALVAIVPLVLIAFGVHLTVVEPTHNPQNPDQNAQPGIDRILVGEGICTMASGLLSGIPVGVKLAHEKKVSKHSVLPILLACLAVLILSLFGFFSYFQEIFPTPIIGGTLVGVLLTIILQGFKLAFPKSAPKTFKNLIFPMVILLVGVAAITLFFIHSIFNLWSDIFVPWGILLAPLSVVVVLAFLVNTLLPFQAKVSSNEPASR